jgi:hypothetical protein
LDALLGQNMRNAAMVTLEGRPVIFGGLTINNLERKVVSVLDDLKAKFIDA